MRQILAGLAEGVILVDRGRVLVWANAAACRMHGVAAPDGLGRTVAEYRKRFVLRYRNRHRLAAASYPLERAVSGESFDDVVVEVTSVRDEDMVRVHRVRGQTILDADGSAALHALFVTDVTDWASAEQRFERAFSANPAPALICRISDLRFVKVNQGFLDMTAFSSDQVLGRSAYEIDVLAGSRTRDAAIAHLSAAETIPQTESDLRIADGTSKLVIVAGQPIEFGEQPCMLFTFADLEPRRKAEVALRQSEERFAKAFAMSPVPTVVCRSDTLQVTDVNDALATLIGKAARELVGQGVADLGLLGTGAARKQALAQVETHHRLRRFECTLSLHEGESIDVVISAETVPIDGRDCLLLAFLDITHRKRRELELVDAVEAIMKDASWFSRPLVERLANVRRGDALVADPEVAALTRRESEVLSLIGEGLPDKAIATRLHLAPRTVRNHATAVYSKLGVRSRAEAMLWARDRGFRAPPKKRRAPR